MADATTVSVLIRARDEASKAFAQVEQNAGKMAAGIAKHRRGIGLAMTAVGGAITAIGVLSIKAASDVEEMRGKFNVVFGSMSGEVEKWASTHAGATNRSRFDLMEYAAALQDTFVPMGFAREEASKFARAVTELAVDIGSFNNQPTEEVVRSLQSALVGNTETVRKYGIVITAASVEQRILNEGWATSKNEITEAMKVQARMTMIMEGSTDAMGDAERTSGSFANQMVGLQAAIKDVQVGIGQALLPVITSLVEKITPIIFAIVDWMSENEKLTKIIVIAVGAIGGLMLVLGPLLLILPGLSVAFGILSVAMGPITAAVLGIAAVIAAGILIYKYWDDIIQKLTDHWKIILPILAIAFAPIALIAAAIAAGILVWKNWDVVVQKVKEALADFAIFVLDVGLKIAETAKAMLGWVPGLTDIKEGLDNAIDSMKGMQQGLRDWSDDTMFHAKITSEAYGGMEDAQMALAQEAAKTEKAVVDGAKNQEKTVRVASDKTVDSLDAVIETTTKQRVAAWYAAREVSRAYVHMEQSLGDSVGVMIRSIEDLEREQLESLAAAQDIADKFTSLNHRQLIDRQSEAETQRDIWRENSRTHQAELQAQTETAARETAAIGASWTTFRNNQDITMKALADAGIGFDKAVELLAERHGVSILQMTQDLEEAEVKYRDTFALMEFAGKESVDGMIADQKRLVSQFEQAERVFREFEGLTVGGKTAEQFAAGGFGLTEVEHLMDAEQKRLAENATAAEKLAHQIQTAVEERDVSKVAGSKQLQINVAGLGAGANTVMGTGHTTIGGAFGAIQDFWTGNLQAGMSDAQLLGQILEAAPDAAWGDVSETVQAAIDAMAVPAMQGGGWAGGRTLVGERGPEIVNLPSGSYVNPHGSRGMGGGSNTFHFHGAVYGLEDLRRVVVEAVRDHAISGGFRGVFGEA